MIKDIKAHPYFSTFVAIVLILTIIGLNGCASLPEGSAARIPIQMATLKVIEDSDTITAAGVIRYTELARSVIDRDIVAVADVVLQALAAENLSPADRLLAQLLVEQIQFQLAEANVLDESQRLSLLQVLSWVEGAARLASE